MKTGVIKLELDKSDLPKGVLDEKDLEGVLGEETGLKKAVEREIEGYSTIKTGGDYGLVLRKTESIENDLSFFKSETAFLREKMAEQSDMLLELTKLVKELTK